MKFRHLVQCRKIVLSLAMCCLFALLASCTVTLTPTPSSTNPGNLGSSSTGNLGTSNVPLSQQTVINAGSVLYDLNTSNGNTLWKRNDTNYVNTPVVANGQVYALKEGVFFSSNPPQIVDIDQASGMQRWAYTLSGSNVLYAFLGITNKALVAEMPNVGLIGLNPQTGAKLWQVAFSPIYVSGMTVLQTSGNIVFVPNASNDVDAFDAATGHILWQKSNNYLQVVSDSGMAFIGASCNSTGFYGDNFCLDAINPSTGAQRWSSPVGASDCSSNTFCNINSNNSLPSISGNVVYELYDYITSSTQGTSTQVQGIDAFNTSTGALLWHYSIPGSQGQIGPNVPNFNIIGSDSSAVYMEDPVGTITALSASNHSVLWKYINPNGKSTQFIASNGTLVVINTNAVTALNPHNGSQLWSTIIS